MLKFANAQERTRFIRFAIVGAIGAVVDFAVFNLLTLLAGMPALTAQSISFSIAVVSNFTWNRLWTFPDARSKPIGRQGLQFVIVSLVGLAIRTPLFAWLEGVLITLGEQILPAGFPFSATFLGHNFSLAFAILVVMLWNYFANRVWTYNDVK